jgi:hypothetical protein
MLVSRDRLLSLRFLETRALEVFPSVLPAPARVVPLRSRDPRLSLPFGTSACRERESATHDLPTNERKWSRCDVIEALRDFVIVLPNRSAVLRRGLDCCHRLFSALSASLILKSRDCCNADNESLIRPSAFRSG